MSWGYRITILCVGFVSFMTFMVISAFRQDFDLVTEDYYGKELQFQAQIDKQKNHAALSENITHTINNDHIVLKFPKELYEKKVEGNIVFFRPSDAKKDVNIKINLKDGSQTLTRDVFSKGLYRIQIDYTVDGQGFYYEEAIVL